MIRHAGSVPYSDAMGLVMKQIEQFDNADNRGLNDTAVSTSR